MANNGSGRWGRRPPSRGRPDRTRSQTIGTTMNSSTTRRLPDGRRIVSTEEFKMLLAARLNFDTENGLLPRSITPGRVGMDQGGMQTPNRIGMTSRRNGQKRWPSSNRRGKAKSARALSTPRQTPYSRPQSASPGRRVLADQSGAAEVGGHSSSGGETDFGSDFESPTRRSQSPASSHYSPKTPTSTSPTKKSQSSGSSHYSPKSPNPSPASSPKSPSSQTGSSQGLGLGKGKGKVMHAPKGNSSTSSGPPTSSDGSLGSDSPVLRGAKVGAPGTPLSQQAYSPQFASSPEKDYEAYDPSAPSYQDARIRSPSGAQSGSESDEEMRQAIALSLQDYHSKAGEAPSQEVSGAIDLSQQGQGSSTQNVEDGKPFPLINLGNTCYMNSALQTLIAADEFNIELVNFVDQAKKLMAGVVEPPVTGTYLELYNEYLERSNLPYVDGRVFVPHLKRFQDVVHEHIHQGWVKGEQQDPTELLEGLLDCMSNDLVALGAGGGNEAKNLVQNYFQILYRGLSLCQNCGAEQETPFELTRLILPFPNERTQSEPVQLNYMVQRYLIPEEMIAKCDNCGPQKTMIKTAAFLRLPKYMIITLNRFGGAMDWINGEYNSWKILTPVTASGDITITCIGPDGSPAEVNYVVFCGVVHIGNSNNSGHYVSYVLNLQNDCWYKCDDSRITNIGKGFPGVLSQGYYFICGRTQEENEEQEGSEGQDEGQAGSS